MENVLFRCSSLGLLMTNPRSKSEVLSETAKSLIKELVLENKYGIKKEFWSKYTDKGLEVEDEAIEFASNVLKWEFFTKNTERYENNFITGEPDVNTDTLLADIKCSWDGSTFPFFETDIPNKNYYWQLQGYMWLTGHRKAELVYCLMNTPYLIVEDEVRRAHWKAGLIDEDIDLRDAVQSQHSFNHIPDENRVKRFLVEYNETDIELLKTRIEEARKEYKRLYELI